MLSEPAINVFETGFAAGWQQLRAQAAPIRTNPQCNACHLKPICKTCAAAALAETGAYDGIPEYCCRYAEEYYRLLLEEAKAYGQDL